MKFDKENPLHWIYLFTTTINIFLTLPFRLLKPKRPIIILYGHKLNGNLIAFYEYLSREHSDEFEVYYLTMDPDYYKQIHDNYNVLFSVNLVHMIKVSRSTAFITDHGLHSLVIYKYLTNIRFIDVWHGIPFKGFDSDDFRSIHEYNQVWVTSPSMKKMYIDKYGFISSKVKVTGYARTDALVNNSYNKSELLRKFDIKDSYSKIVLVAPTWKQDDSGRSIFPFETDAEGFLGELNIIGQETNSLIIFRAHLNSKDNLDYELTNIKFMSFDNYPTTEEILFISDILISDWSSISFDYLVLRRPTIFLDVKPPFSKGFSYDASYRFGDIVKNMEELLKVLKNNLQQPDLFPKKYAKKMDEVSKEVYSNYSDGKAAERYYNYLVKDSNEE